MPELIGRYREKSKEQLASGGDYCEMRRGYPGRCLLRIGPSQRRNAQHGSAYPHFVMSLWCEQCQTILGPGGPADSFFHNLFSPHQSFSWLVISLFPFLPSFRSRGDHGRRQMQWQALLHGSATLRCAPSVIELISLAFASLGRVLCEPFGVFQCILPRIMPMMRVHYGGNVGQPQPLSALQQCLGNVGLLLRIRMLVHCCSCSYSVPVTCYSYCGRGMLGGPRAAQLLGWGM